MSRFVLLLALVGCGGESPDAKVPTPRDRDGDGADTTVDCNDHRADVFPGAAEVCDGVDQDCDAEIDEEAVDEGTWYGDTDHDGHGSPYTYATACVAPDGMVATADDCDDTVGAVHPGAPEICDGLDNDCDGGTDNDTVDGVPVYTDADGDGFGAPGPPIQVCEPAEGQVGHAGDCDDARADVHRFADERCDGVDNNCDGATDEAGAVDAATWYEDRDGDSYGDDATAAVACTSPYADGVTTGGDCGLDAPEVNPGAYEPCDDADGADQDCDGVVDPACWSGSFSWRAVDLDGNSDVCVATLTGEAAPFRSCADCEWTWAADPEPVVGCQGIDTIQFGLLGAASGRAVVQVELAPLEVHATFDPDRGWLDLHGSVLNEVDGVTRRETIEARLILPVR